MRLRRVEPILRRALRGLRTGPNPRRLLVAVSGGADSTALLLGLHNVAHEFGIGLVAAHLHHGLRGPDADRDLEFVRALCSRQGIPLRAARWDTRRRMRQRGLSGQDGLRRLRREFLTAAARRANADAIATAHTADDQLETVLLRLARGTGLRGLGAMSPRTGRWTRPLLGASRADIEADLRTIGQAWREDRSNRDVHYARNRVRHEVVPGLLRAASGDDLESGRALEMRGKLAKRVAFTARDVRRAYRAIERRAARLLDRTRSTHGSDGVSIDCSKLPRRAEPVVRVALERAWASLGVDKGLTRPALRSVLRLALSRREGRVSLASGWNATRLGATLRIERRKERIEGGTLEVTSVRSLKVPGRVRFGGTVLRASWLDGSEARRVIREDQDGECFASGHLKGRLELRLGRTDEMFVPFGRREPRRLGAFLKREGFHEESRRGQMVLADEQGILWVVGVRRSARAPLTPGTRRALWVRGTT